MMKKCKQTILKTTLQEDLAKEYGIPDLGPCPLMKEGQVFYADYAKPEGFCDEAWKAIYQYVFALAHGADAGWYYDDWMDPKHKGWPSAPATTACVRSSSRWSGWRSKHPFRTPETA